jgi:hypothetical protein
MTPTKPDCGAKHLMWFGILTTIFIFIVGSAWAAANKQTSAVDAKVDRLEPRVVEVEKKAAASDERFQAIKDSLTRIEKRLEK